MLLAVAKRRAFSTVVATRPETKRRIGFYTIAGAAYYAATISFIVSNLAVDAWFHRHDADYNFFLGLGVYSALSPFWPVVVAIGISNRWPRLKNTQ